jgi:hypothetical protein
MYVCVCVCVLYISATVIRVGTAGAAESKEAN